MLIHKYRKQFFQFSPCERMIPISYFRTEYFIQIPRESLGQHPVGLGKMRNKENHGNYLTLLKQYSQIYFRLNNVI